MHTEWSVDLTEDGPTLTFPWKDPEGRFRYVRLKTTLSVVEDVPEARDYPELRLLLLAANAPESPLETARCDVWGTDEVDEGECWWLDEVPAYKFGCYVDLLFSAPNLRESFSAHESLGRELVDRVGAGPDVPGSVEFIVGRAYYCDSPAESSSRGSLSIGFYVVAYVFGYGASVEDARRNWAGAVRVVTDAVSQVKVL